MVWDETGYFSVKVDSDNLDKGYYFPSFKYIFYHLCYSDYEIIDRATLMPRLSDNDILEIESIDLWESMQENQHHIVPHDETPCQWQGAMGGLCSTRDCYFAHRIGMPTGVLFIYGLGLLLYS